jgi:hypothetical protein
VGRVEGGGGVGAMLTPLQQKCNPPTISWSFMKNVSLHFITTLTKYSSMIQKVALPVCKRNSCKYICDRYRIQILYISACKRKVTTVKAF